MGRRRVTLHHRLRARRVGTRRTHGLGCLPRCTEPLTTSASSKAQDEDRRRGLQALAAEVRRDFERMLFPAPDWVPPVAGPDGRPALDVLVIGSGMCGQTAAFALARDGVRNIRVIDRSARGREGPWGTYARMDTLRSPKHLTGPDLGFPALTFRAWYEAQHGPAGWQRLSKVVTADWLAYLL